MISIAGTTGGWTAHPSCGRPVTLRVEYAKRRKEYGILFIFSLKPAL